MRVRWLRRARRQLDEAGEHIARNNPTAAARVVLRIRHAVDTLANQPLLGRPGRVIGTRELVVTGTPYLVAYRVREQTVEILVVQHAARQWPKSFE